MTRQERREQIVETWRSTEWSDVALFLGPNADRFASAWEKTRAKWLARKTGIAFALCWPALFFGFAWFLYRKQWAIGATLLIFPVVLGYLTGNRGGLVGVSIVIAMYAKSFVVTDAVLKISKLRARGAGDEEVAAAGGVSVWGGAIGGVILVAALYGLWWSFTIDHAV